MRNSVEPFGQIIGLFIGKVKTPWEGKEATAIAKKAVDAPLWLNKYGFDGDEQADKEVHGGVDQAIHHYSADHLPFWRDNLPEIKHVIKPGCFGENISAVGLDENNLCIGDVIAFGTAKVQVTQGRQPCWKLDAHTGSTQTSKQFLKTGKTGWYYRVLETGLVSVGDFINVIERPAPNWPIARVIEARFESKLNTEIACDLANLAHLSQDWRKSFAQKY